LYVSSVHSPVVPLPLLSDRWLIEALSQLSSNERVRDAAAAWLAAYTAALRRGFGEADAQARADEALRRVAGRDPEPQGGVCVAGVR
jgi:hypothetical protein